MRANRDRSASSLSNRSGMTAVRTTRSGRYGGRTGDVLERGVRADVRNPPAVAVEHDPERQQQEVVPFAGRAGEQREGPWP